MSAVEVRLVEPGQDWDEAAARLGGGLYHQSAWIENVVNCYGGRAYYLAAMQGDRIVGVLPLVEKSILGSGRVLISLPCADGGGVCADSVGVREALISKAVELGRERRAAYVEIRQMGEVPVEGVPCDDTRVVLQMPLPDTAEELWQAFSSNMRKKIRRARRDGCTARDGREEDLRIVYDIYARNTRDLGSPMHGWRFFEGVRKSFGERMYLKVVELEGQPIAAALAVGFGKVFYVLFAHSLRRYVRFFPNNLLYWALFEAAIAGGYEVADFGRSPKGSGIYNFKKSFGMDDVPLHFIYVPVLRRYFPHERRESVLYRYFTRLWRHCPMPVARWLGPQIFGRLSL